ncbi:hypothetical protein QBC33DRAFT_235286 [Phialemonium atrogriseum]|uniref:Uncharacterized protein n=1 Tax=Phialemonium atrogriseum TaxID=1093897 RepID=A0AAJ0C915_9PEZI|nr:uncharacterized protein QBC33DRAFT_235286 [Phialemonium atrogriseum]KAK1771183.1 hypothetical protein QBC33DRAFT_235286 [Phialemonium atrogriseum]
MEETKKDASPAPLGRILDRKIESKGLAESFSANISRKGTPRKNRAGKSVKAIVEWLEKAGGKVSHGPEAKGKPGSDKGSISISSPSSSSKDAGDKQHGVHHEAQHENPPAGPVTPSPRPHPFAEEYSLTLLKFKSYFNNRPLARCLDHLEQDFAQTEKKPGSYVPSKLSQEIGSSSEGKGGDGTNPRHVRDPAEVTAF